MWNKSNCELVTWNNRKYQTLKRKIYDHIGYFAEIYMAQVLWRGQRKKLPWQFFYIRHRVRLGAAAKMEVDLYAASGAEV